MLWTVHGVSICVPLPRGSKLTVEVANSQQTGSLEAGGQRVDNAVVIWQKKSQNGHPQVPPRSFTVVSTYRES
jgi:hypothetical protein